MRSRFFSFIQECPSSYHTSAWLKDYFKSRGFIPLTSKEQWKIEFGKQYLFQKEGTFFAVSLPEVAKKEIKGLRSFGAHTDSPGLKLKPLPIVERGGSLFLSLEIYGSPILPSWFNRDLILAGRIFTEKGEQKVHLKTPKGIIAALPPHLHSKEKGGHEEINVETELLALLRLDAKNKETFFEDLFGEKVIAHDLFLVPDQPPEMLFDSTAIAAPRLDNLASVFALAEGFAASHDRIQFALFWDHEEIGSRSERGADSTLFSRFLTTLLQELSFSPSEIFTLQENSLMISLDNAHAYHPLFPTKFSENHAPHLGLGIALKESAALKYGTSGSGLAAILPLLQEKAIPTQYSVVRNDLRGGSTLGPFVAASIGATTIDIGLPQLSMHSAREIIAESDLKSMIEAISLICKS